MEMLLQPETRKIKKKSIVGYIGFPVGRSRERRGLLVVVLDQCIVTRERIATLENRHLHNIFHVSKSFPFQSSRKPFFPQRNVCPIGSRRRAFLPATLQPSKRWISASSTLILDLVASS